MTPKQKRLLDGGYSKKYSRAFVAEILAAAKKPPEAIFDNGDDMLAYLNGRVLIRHTPHANRE
jgi:hypothetical protein